MAQFCPNNRDVACYLVTKHSWKGKYKRIFSIGTLAITTYSPQTLEITNQWMYEDFVSIKPSPRNASSDSKQDEFVIHVRSRGKKDNMRFSSDYTTDILTECLTYSSKFSERLGDPLAINAFKHSWSERRVPVVLRAGPAHLEQMDNRGVIVQSYAYRHIKSIGRISDVPGGFKIELGDHRRRHLFASANMEDFLKEVRRQAAENVGAMVYIDKEVITLDDFHRTRLGLCSRDEALTSYVEFRVQKSGKRHEYPVRRLLCLSESCLIERDPDSYAVVCATPLKQIVCLARMERDPQQFVIEYETGEGRIYAAAERDLILASLLDGTRAAGNHQVFVTGHRFDRSLRLIPHGVLLDEDGEGQCMRHIVSPPPGLKRSDLIRRFNANIPYDGLTYSKTHEGFFSENKGKVIVAALEAVLTEQYDKADAAHMHKSEAQMQCLHRLFASKSGFQAFTEVPGVREKLGILVVRCLALKNEAVDHATVEALCALMHPMHNQYEIRTEQHNKRSLLSSAKFIEELLDLVVNHVERSSGSLVIASMLDFLTYSVCAPYSETTDGSTFDAILKMVAQRGRAFYRLFQSPSMTIVKGAGMVMRAIIEEADVETSKQMQTLALTEGAFLTHLQTALLAKGKDLRVLTNKQLSGHLISLWIADNQQANDLLSRCLPRGLLNFLESDAAVPVKEANLLIPRNNLEAATNEMKQQGQIKEKIDQFRIATEAGLERFIQNWDLEQKLNFTIKRTEDKQQQQRPIVLRKRRQRIKSSVNWRLFVYQFQQDHGQADLLWNERTRTEYGKALENEQALLQAEKDRTPGNVSISWNHSEFQVRYPSLEEEIKIGDYYLRLLLQEADENATPIHNATEFFNNVYHRFLLSTKSDMRSLCLRAMGITYGRHHMTIGPFADAKYFVSMLQKCTNQTERDHTAFLLSKLVQNKDNVRELIQANLLPILVDLCDLSHLHVQRATIQNQSNVIEASADQMAHGGSAEWFYNDKDGQRQGPLPFERMKELYKENVIFEKTPVWASGMDQWQNLSAVPQFRWTICVPQGASAPLFNFTQLCTLCLDILIQMCEFFPARDENDSVVRPMPQVKLRLTEPLLLYHIVQLLLTYEPSIVQRVATLLLHVIQDNPFLPRLYLSGVFFFILMYNGSNVLPIAKFLHYTHMKQAFRSALPQFDGIQQSVLTPLLPEAATYYLEHYGPEKYAEVYLGEFDNPEIIWNTDMRRHMIERIALHVSDFTHRLTSNVKALYQFCPIAFIDYPELQDELFCHVYYLRHLCDEQRFPDWPIRDPIPFLRACLAAWFEELEKKPPAMSIEMAVDTLGLSMDDDGWRDPSSVRRAYFKMAAKYHPDKLGDRKDKELEYREKFEQAAAAYELLSNNAASSDMPDTQRLVLCLKAQSIIYSRYSEELSIYKYAGYGQLIRTIALEAKDETLFQQGGGALLSAAIELTNHTLRSSALNAEQLRRDQGLEALQSAFDRCVPMVTQSSTSTDMPVQVCEHICNCIGTAARFEACRQRIAEMPTVFGNLCRLLQFPNLARLSAAAADCICQLAVDTLLQTQLFQTGVLWQLVPHLFHYDYTLDEGGVAHNENTNKQTLANKLARNSLEALACLAGFREATPPNDGVQNSLRALLTPYVCHCLQKETNDMVLKTLNSNTENPYLIWDNGTRAELMEFVEAHRNNTEQTSELFGAEFELSVHAKELIVGDIFVRIYNDQPDFQLFEPKKVAMDLLEFIGRYVDELSGRTVKKENGDLIDWSSNANKMNPEDKVLQCLRALANLIVANPACLRTGWKGVEFLLIGHFPLLVSFIRCRKHPEIQLATLKVISLAAGNRECLGDLSNVRTCSALFTLLWDRKDAVPLILNCLISLASNGQIVKELLDYGGLMYILSVLCNIKGDQGERLLAAELLAKLQADKLTGPRWSRFISKFLPPIFADALRESPNSAIMMFDTTNENPELIWNEESRAKVASIVEKEVQQLYTAQIKDPDAKWNTTSLSDEKTAYGDSVSGELVVGGVFVRLYVANPAWVVRHPRQFATELIERVLELMNRPNKDLTLVTSAFVELMRHHPNTADQLPAQGYLPQFCSSMSAKDPATSRAAILILQRLAENQYCADALAKLNCVEGIMMSMKNQPTLMRESAHALKCLMKRQSGDLASQMLSCGMVHYLLEVLKGELPGVENAAAAKAEIVDALKSACLDLKMGEKISEVLDKSPVWAQYRDQNHDLFLPSTRTAAITGGTSGVSGYLTDTMFNPPPMHSQPPPL